MNYSEEDSANCKQPLNILFQDYIPAPPFYQLTPKIFLWSFLLKTTLPLLFTEGQFTCFWKVLHHGLLSVLTQKTPNLLMWYSTLPMATLTAYWSLFPRSGWLGTPVLSSASSPSRLVMLMWQPGHNILQQTSGKVSLNIVCRQYKHRCAQPRWKEIVTTGVTTDPLQL